MEKIIVVSQTANTTSTQKITNPIPYEKFLERKQNPFYGADNSPLNGYGGVIGRDC